ncbi:MAG TPA: VOC family protein, partial [Pyrinomonadaceae bacterium]|nr:VOC family protein [Pyrinomonadaceae bacterium]
YVKVFPNSEIVGTMPGPDGKPAGGTFTLNGEQFHCFNGGEHFKFSEGISFSINAETQEEIDYFYDTLSAGGEQQPCGWLKDRFGVSWQVIPSILVKMLSDTDREKAGRVAQAMFAMKKIQLADIMAAARS